MFKKISDFFINILDLKINKNINNTETYNYDYNKINDFAGSYHNLEKKEKLVDIYIPKDLMTNCEKEFYNKIKDLESMYKIIPQINLATIIHRESSKRYQNELYRNIDFAIFSHDYSNLLLLIELNDSSHNKKERKRRDKKVNNICYQAGIRLITFYTNCSNEKQYIIKRILDEINKNINQNS